MTDTTATSTAALENFGKQAEQDAVSTAEAEDSKLKADAEKTTDDLMNDLDQDAQDLLALGKQISEKVYGDAKADLSAFIEKLPEPLPLLLQTVAASSEQVLGALGDQAYEGLQSHEKTLVTDTKAICGRALALVEAYFHRAA